MRAPTKPTTGGTPVTAGRVFEAVLLALVAAGRTNRQIGGERFISPKTASVHVSNILAKLGVTSRVEAAAVAHRLNFASYHVCVRSRAATARSRSQTSVPTAAGRGQVGGGGSPPGGWWVTAPEGVGVGRAGGSQDPGPSPLTARPRRP